MSRGAEGLVVGGRRKRALEGFGMEEDIQVIAVGDHHYRARVAWSPPYEPAVIVSSGHGRYRCVLRLPAGVDEAWLKSPMQRLARETSVHIQVDALAVTLQADSEEAAREARARVEALLVADSLAGSGGPSTSGKRERPTHFVALPLNATWLQDRASELQSRIVETGGHGIDVDKCISPERLHCTLTTLRLTTDEQLERAVRTVSGLRNAVWDTLERHALFLQVGHLGVFPPGQVRQARVLYAEVRDAGDTRASGPAERLHAVCALLCGRLHEDGVMSERELRETMKLNVNGPTFHCTLLKVGDGSGTMNASVVVARLASSELGEVRAEDIRLLRMQGGADVDGFYQAECSIPLP